LVVLADGSGNKPVFQCSTGSSGCSWTGASQIKDGKWHHLAGVRTGDTAHLYVDGRREKGEPTKAFGDVTNQERMYIGRTSWCGTSGYLIGAVDEFRLYNRALTEQEVLVLYVNVGCETLAGDDEKKIASLIEQLGAGDPQARREAKSKLKEMGRKALPVLMRYKDHQDPEIRATVEELLKP
jgi:hypothetical protein